jgi:hypothetical protein
MIVDGLDPKEKEQRCGWTANFEEYALNIFERLTIAHRSDCYVMLADRLD